MPPWTQIAWQRKTATPTGISPTTFMPASATWTTEKTPNERFDAIDKIGLLQGQKHNLDVTKLQSCFKAQNEDAVRASMKEADGLGVNATPTLFINGQKIDGAVPVSQLRAALDSALKDAGQPVPQHTPSAPAPASK